ncbi:VWA domain-containing protein, partial [Verrucomicrobia bacterium]|nr:VWA domain-containing protein [Verrucomicrobiota bacterium]
MNFTIPSFVHPYLLLLLLLLPLLAWLRGRSGRGAAFLYSSVALVKGITDLRKSSSGLWGAKLRWLALALCIIALARPRLGEGETAITASGIDIVVAVDLSGSMAAEDFTILGSRVNRLAAAKNVLEEFVDKRRNDRIGLVAFAGRAYIAAPLTL